MATPRSCLNCNKTVMIPKNRESTFKFCSRSCSFRYKSKNQSINVRCKICDSEFYVIFFRKETARYCSRKCYYQSLKNKGNTKYTCLFCNKKFIGHNAHKRKYCSMKCIQKRNHLEWSPKTPECVRKMMNVRGLINKCSRCGFSEHKEILGIHHKDRNNKNNKMENLEVLCPNCHSIEHKKHIVH